MSYPGYPNAYKYVSAQVFAAVKLRLNDNESPFDQRLCTRLEKSLIKCSVCSFHEEISIFLNGCLQNYADLL